MAIERVPNLYNSYNESVGGFKGLFNSLDAALIPDGYLADMKNVKIDDFGVMHNVMKPSNPDSGIKIVEGISKPFTMYFLSGNKIFDSAGVSVWTLGSGGVGIAHPRVITYIGGYYLNDAYNGLVALSPTPHIVTSANSAANFTPVNSYAICVFKDRLYFTLGSILRYSAPYDASLDTTWNGDNINNFIDVKFSGEIVALAPTSAGLFVFTSGRVYLLTEPKTGSFFEVYSGQDIPSIYEPGTGYCDGRAYYYGTRRGLFSFDGSPHLLSNKLSLDNGTVFAGSYDHRLWFLCRTTGDWGDPNSTSKIYALNTLTGAWEKYEGWVNGDGGLVNFISLLGGGDSVFNDMDTLFLGAYDTTSSLSGVYAYGGGFPPSTEVWPWEFTTKNFTPSLDAFSRPKSVKITYAGQPATSVATIKLYTDGVLKDTVALDMYGSGLYHREIQIVADAGNSFQLNVSGSGTMDIKDIGIEFSPRHKGDDNA
jgi:hypothetical protein